LNTTCEQIPVLKHTLAEFTQAFNFVCEVGWQTEEKNGVRLHHATYYTVKELCKGLVSDLIVQARTKATEALKSSLTKKKQGKRVSQPHSQLCPARYNLHTYKMNWTTQTVNLATSPGNRLTIGFTVSDYAKKYLGYPTDTADLIYRKGRFWLHVVVTLPAPALTQTDEVIGIDLGLNRPAVTSKRKFLGGRNWKEVDRRNFRLKRALQSKGTKSARRHLKKLAGKNLRFHRDSGTRLRVYVLSKRIVQSATPGATLVIENLTDIRTTSKIGGRKSKTKRRLHSWSFAQFRAFLSYKAQEAGMHLVAIDPRHTSQTCSKCSYQHRSNRKSQSLFLCKKCAYQLNADLNASYNIADKHLASFGISLAGGPQSIGLSHPSTSVVEVQAALL